jgi:hypothetical protein
VGASNLELQTRTTIFLDSTQGDYVSKKKLTATESVGGN